MSDEIRNLSLEDHLGFDSLPNQLCNKAAQNSFVFNILCVGETGIGKSTLMESLFNKPFDSQCSEHHLSSIELKSQTYDLHEKGVHLKLTIVDTVGYGDQIKKRDDYKNIVEYIDQQFEAYMQEELKVNRYMPLYQDSRIHACLYFICPTGHGLKPLDIICMKKIGSKVNLIPIIAKADAIAKSEIKNLKEKIMTELQENSVSIYQFPVDDESVVEVNKGMNAHIPFAVVGSRDFVQIGNQSVRARQYPWGIVQVENDAHCDFSKLREMLIRTNMEDLREVTHSYHYERYRKMRLNQSGITESADGDYNVKPVVANLSQTLEENLALLKEDLAEKSKKFEQNLTRKMKDAELALCEEEEKIRFKWQQIKVQEDKERDVLEQQYKILHDEMTEFQRLKFEFEQPKRSSLSRLWPGSKSKTNL